MKTVLVTGAGGFIARLLAARCKRDGWRVVGTVRRAGEVADFDATYLCALGDSLREVLSSERVDAVVHAAYTAGRGEYAVNVGGTGRWLEEARSANVPLQVFLSSLSAAVSGPSEYGRAKLELEGRFLAADGVVVRLGLVAGNGGIFGRMIDSVRRLPILPLLDGGRSLVHVVDPRFLADFVTETIRRDGRDLRGRVWQIHHATPYTLREVLTRIRSRCGSHCRFVSVPSLPILWGLAVVERIPGLKLPVRSTNLRGLRQSPHHRAESDLARLGGTERPLDALIAEATDDAFSSPVKGPRSP
jgi:nucleoside-diphosphate-sugar epimerase